MWIEISKVSNAVMDIGVTPYAGVWIEIQIFVTFTTVVPVTPYAGVWIEIIAVSSVSSASLSLPTRECGLKFSLKLIYPCPSRHSLRGSVD